MTLFASSLVTNNFFTISQAGTRVAVLEYSNVPSTWWKLSQTTSSSSVQTSIRNLQLLNQARDLYSTLLLLRTEVFATVNGGRANASNVALLIIDGEPNVNVANTINEAVTTRKTNIRLLVVGITSAVSSGTIQFLSSPPQTLGVTYWLANNYFDLGLLTAQVASAACTRLAGITVVITYFFSVHFVLHIIH